MSEPQFDPYYAWLGIPPQQKKHYYNLLGLQLWESNPGVIEGCADRQMAHVRTFKLGPHADRSQKLLSELAQARLCLLSPEKKAAYDAALRPQLETPAAVKPIAVKPTAVAPLKPTPVAPASAAGSPAGMGQPTVARAVPARAVAAQSGSAQPMAAQPVSSQAFPAQPFAGQPAAAQAAGPGGMDLGLPSLPTFGAPPPAAAPTGGDEFGLSAAAASVGLPTLAPPPPPPSPPGHGINLGLVGGGAAALVAGLALAIYLVAFSGPRTGVLALELPPEGRSAVVLKVDDRVVAMPESGGFEMELPPGPHKYHAARPGYFEQYGELKVERGKRYNPAVSWRPEQALLLELGDVPAADVQLHLDGKPVALAGSPAAGAAVEVPVKSGRLQLRLARAGHEPFETSFDLATGQTRTVSPLWTVKLGEPMDVLAKVEPARDALLGKWVRSPVGVSNAVDQTPSLALPVRIEGSYDLQVDFTRTAGGNAVIVGLPVGSTACRLVLGGWMGEAAGLEDVDGRGGRRNATTVAPSKFPNDERQRLEIAVRTSGEKARIYVRHNGLELLSWSGAASALTPPDPKFDARPPSPPGQPTLHTWSSACTFHTVRLRPADDGKAEWAVDGKSAAPPAANQLPPLIAKLPPVGNADRRTASETLGHPTNGGRYELLSGAPAVVVGVEYTTVLTNPMGGTEVCLNTIQPVFASAEGVRLGLAAAGKIEQDDGKEMTTPRRVVAKEGYALAGFVALADMRIWGLSAVFCRATETGLDLSDRYDEPLFPIREGVVPPRTLLTDGRPVVGLQGGATNEVDSVGIIVASLGEGAAAPLPPIPPTGSSDWKAPVDLLKFVELPADSEKESNWTREGDALVSTSDGHQQFYARYELPKEFDLHVAFIRESGEGGVAIRTRIGEVGWTDARIELAPPIGTGFDVRDGNPNFAVPRTGRIFPENGRKYSILYRVRNDGAEALVDGESVLLYRGDFSAMKNFGWPHRGMWFYTSKSTTRVTRLELAPPAGPLGGKAEAPTATPDAPTEPELTKVPAPSKEQLVAEEQKIRREYKKFYDEAGANGDPALAAKLLLKGRQLDISPEERYANLEQAADMAVGAGMGMIVGLAYDEMQRQFEVDVWPLRVKALTETVKRARNPADLWTSLEEVGKLRRVVTTPAQLAEVAALMNAVEQAGKRVGVADATKRLQDDRKQLDLFKPLCATAEKAAEYLVSNPEPVDPAAALALGTWKVFAQGDWKGGLPLLEKSGDRKLAPAAAALAKNMKDPAAQLAMADALWDWRPASGQAYPPSATRGAAREWYFKAGPDEAQLTKMQRAFAAEAFPEQPGSPRGWTVPMLGLGGWRAIGPAKAVGEAQPGKAVGSWLSTTNERMEILYPRTPIDTFVHEFSVKLTAKQGSLTINYGDLREDRVVFRIFWNDSDKDFFCRLYSYRVGIETSWKDTLRYPSAKQLDFTLYGTPGKFYLYEGGQPVTTAEATPGDLTLSFFASQNAAAEIGKFQLRPWTVRDTETVKRLGADPETAAETAKRGLELELENLGVSEKPILAAGAPFVCGTSRSPMQWIAPGSFKRISTYNDVPPCDIVLTKGFWLGRYEVTQAAWTAVAGGNPSRTIGSRYLPVDGVSWEDAMRYCQRLNVLEKAKIPPGYEYRLPTEAEWEYACRAGVADDFSVNRADFWHSGNSRGRMKQVGLSKANPWGLYDMYGNAGEWCIDRAISVNGKPTRLENPVVLPTDPEHERRVRGGGWYRNAASCSPKFWFNEPNLPATGRGFRICLGPAIR